MADPYSVGTVSVENGGTVVSGTGTFWAGKVRKNDLFTDPEQGLFARVLADATENDELLINPWPGAEIADGQYEIMDTADGVDTAARLRALLAAMGVVQANGRGLFYYFDDSIAATMPSSGQLRLNAVNAAEASEAFVSLYDAEGASVSAELASWGDGTSPIKGRLYLRSIARPSVLHSYFVTASGAGSFATLAFVHIGGTGSFEPGEALMAVFSTKGDQGEAFHTDADAADMAGLDAFADEDDGFRVFVTDLGAAHDHRSGVVEKASGSWPVVSYYTGATGPISTVPGPPGPMGVNPLNSPFDAETVYALNDLVLDNGSTWRAIQDGFAGFAPPVLPATSNEYWMLFARAGTDGAGTVAGIGQGSGISVDSTDPTTPVISLDAAFSDLKDVDFTTNPPEEGNVPVWDATLEKFVPGEGGGGGEMDAARIKGRVSAGSGPPEDLTATQVLTLLKTAGAYAKDNILGAVSQLAGVPTGALLESGSNANGSYVKFADGTMICASPPGAVGQQSGVTYIIRYAWTFPAAFISAPAMSGGFFLTTTGGVASSDFDKFVVSASSTSATAGDLSARGIPGGVSWSSGTTLPASAMAIGRWF